MDIFSSCDLSSSTNGEPHGSHTTDHGPDLESSLLDWRWAGPGHAVPVDEDGSLWDFESCFFTSGEGCDLGDLAVVDMDDENDHPIAPDLLSELALASIRDLPDPRKKRQKKVRQPRIRVIDEEDFENEKQRKLVIILRARIKRILNGHPNAREDLEYFFLPPSKDEKLPFEWVVINIFYTEPITVRLRLQSYLYRHWIVLSDSMGILAAGAPENVINAGLLACGGNPLAATIIRDVWAWPGITIPQLIEDAVRRNLSKELAITVIQHILQSRQMLEQGENCYVVGHYGPLLERINPWSRPA